MRSAPPAVFLNGRLVPAHRAAVSVYDRGLLYGDGLFETVRAYCGVVFALEAHLARLRRSARALGLPVPPYDWRHVLGRLLTRNRLADCDASIRITLTRGAAPLGLLPPPRPRPTTVIMARPAEAELVQHQARGVTVHVLDFDRGGLPAEHKGLHYLPSIMGRLAARRAGAYEGVFVSPEGLVREGTTTSLFIAYGGRLVTSPVHGILPGITRARVIHLARRLGIATEERDFTVAEMQAADEVFLTASVAEIVPVVRIGAAMIGRGAPGPLTRRLQDAYRRAVKAYCARRLKT